MTCTGLKNLHPVIPDRVSDELYEKTIGKINKNPLKYTSAYKNLLIHIVDSCSRGYITPLEVYTAIEQKYIPEYLTVRPSAYSHLL